MRQKIFSILNSKESYEIAWHAHGFSYSVYGLRIRLPMPRTIKAARLAPIDKTAFVLGHLMINGNDSDSSGITFSGISVCKCIALLGEKLLVLK